MKTTRTRARDESAGAQRPWHFLYLAPDPHQHGSLRPIRSPVGRVAGLGPGRIDGAPAAGDARDGRAGARRAVRDGLSAEGRGDVPRRRRARQRAAEDRRARGPGRDRLGGGRAGAIASGSPRPRCPTPRIAATPRVRFSATAASPPDAGCRWTVTRKIDDATPWRMRSRNSSYIRNASRRNSLSGSCWA